MQEIGKTAAELGLIAEEQKAHQAKAGHAQGESHRGEPSGGQHGEQTGGEHGSPRGHGDESTRGGHEQTAEGQHGESRGSQAGREPTGRGQQRTEDYQYATNRGDGRYMYPQKNPYSVIVNLHPVRPSYQQVMQSGSRSMLLGSRPMYNQNANYPNSQLYHVPQATG